MKKDVCKLVKETYGITNNFLKTGYIMPDGSKLDFATACPGDRRCIDHNDVRDVLYPPEYDSQGGDTREIKPWDAVYEFKNNCGAIRFAKLDAGVFIDTGKQKPTDKQIIQLKKAINDSPDVFLEKTGAGSHCYISKKYPSSSIVGEFIKKCYE